MKYLIALLSMMIFIVVGAYAYQEEQPAIAEPEKKPEVFCPVTKISDNDKCMTCHAMQVKDGKPYWGLKELPPDANYTQKPGCIEIVKDGEGIAAYMEVSGTNSRYYRQAADYLYWHPEIKKLIVELQTGGGSIMDAWKSVGIIKEMQSRGIVVENRCYGLAASAGVVLLVAGDIGHRYVNPHAEIMLHKVWTFQMFDLKTPDTAEDQAQTLKHFQKNINSFILSRSKMTQEQLDEGIFKRDFWMTGAQAVKYGLADGLIGE